MNSEFKISSRLSWLRCDIVNFWYHRQRVSLAFLLLMINHLHKC